MEKTQILEALNKAKEISPVRNFKQSIDIIINLRGINMKKTEHNIDVFVSLPYGKGKKTRVCALIGPELEDNAKMVCDKYILVDDFPKYKKSDIRKVAEDFNFFIAQANIMPKIASSFGRVLGPRGKMPNPKAGCIVPPNANLTQIYERLQKTVRVNSKSSPLLQCSVGTEDTSLEHIADNVLTVYSSVLNILPNEKNNIKDVYLKFTMGKPVKIQEKVKEVRRK